MPASLSKAIFVIMMLLAIYSESAASHIRAGEITAVRLDCAGRTYRITVTVYLETSSPILFGGPPDVLNFGDSTFVLVPETPTVPRPDLGKGMGMASFTIDHTYSAPGKFLIRYAEAFRNLNIANLGGNSQMFYIETSIFIDSSIGCDSAPLLLVPPIDKACSGVAWFHNPGAYDVDGDSLSYELIVPFQAKGVKVTNYRAPNEKEFYDKAGINYNSASEDHSTPPSLRMDPRTGTIVWDTPGSQGDYNIAFLIKEWRLVDGVWTQLGYVERDMQIIVEDCKNKRPEFKIPAEICVEAGQLITEDIFAFDPDSDSIRIEAFSDVFFVAEQPARMIPGPNNGNVSLVPSSPLQSARATFSWQTNCSHVKDQSYQVVFKVTDSRALGPRLTGFVTWSIRVVGPEPNWDAVTVVGRLATLTWDPYACANAERMEVWRRVDRYPFTINECIAGMPAFLGFTKVGDVPIAEKTYTDTNSGRGLAVGAQYCYRLVAVFRQPGGAESYVSRDTCLVPIPADAPVITNVSITKTHTQEGKVLVRWRSSFDLDKTFFPPPYKFEVWRADGVVGKIKLTNLTPARLTDSSFVDSSIGLNTEGSSYNYRIVQYTNSGRQDTSFAASTVRIEPTPRVRKIELSWTADVPWSNWSYRYPYHLIYRGTPDEQLVLIDSVDVNSNGFRYVDIGQYKNTPLRDSEVYCYYVETRGTYGNPRIAEPLKNLTQIICAQPTDTLPPCTPRLNSTAMSCEEQALESSCGLGPFTNLLTWVHPPSDCGREVRSYEVWAANKKGAEFTMYRQNVRDTFFIDSDANLESFARCYKVLAVDWSNNKSELSEEFCFDNCPYYELPNVFTPNGDDFNELFRAFGHPSDVGPVEVPDDELRQRCARFVESVDFQVFNRWGIEVFRAVNLREDQIYVSWDGRDTQGNELSRGVYYYKAQVHVITVDPNKNITEVKGWVQLIR